MPRTPVSAASRCRSRRGTPVPASKPAATPSSDRFLRSRNTPRLKQSFLEAETPAAVPSCRPFTRSCASTPRTTTGNGNVVILADQTCLDFDRPNEQLRQSLPRKASSKGTVPHQLVNTETPITKRIRQVLRDGIHSTPLVSTSASASASTSISALALQSRKRQFDDQEMLDDLEESYTSNADSQRFIMMLMYRRNRVPQTPKLRKTVVATKHKESEKGGSNSLIWRYFKTEAVVNKSRGRNQAGRFPMVCTYIKNILNRHLNSMFLPLKRLFR